MLSFQTHKNGGTSSLRMNKLLYILLGKPTVDFCEKPTTGLIKRPFYALSNLAFFVPPVLIYLRDGFKTKLAKAFAFTSVLIGSLSFLYDASYTYISQLFDLSGMLIFVNLLLFLNLKRLKRSNLVIQFIFFLLSIFLIFFLKGYSGNIIFGLYVFAVLISENILYREKIHSNYSSWFVAFSLFAVGFMIWLPDVTQKICFSLKLLNGRAVFHYLTASSVYFLYDFYAKNKHFNLD
jgi:hypothetical protein